jgi:tetratricopeptide (TPR) repeat protein
VTRAVVAVACIALAAAAARAEPPTVDHYETGKRLFTAKRYAEALDEFRRALALAPRPEVLYAIAQAQRMVGDCPGAVQTYRAFLAGQPGEPLDEYARANIQRCEADRRSSRGDGDPGPDPAWYRDGVGDALAGGGLVAGVIGAVIWRSGRSTADAVANAPDYQTFVQRQSAAASALTEQRVGIAAMVVGGAALVAGVVHYVRHAHPAPREPALSVAPTAGGAMLAGHGTF